MATFDDLVFNASNNNVVILQSAYEGYQLPNVFFSNGSNGSTMLQAALDYANSLTNKAAVLIYPGTYQIRSEVTIYPDVPIIGVGKVVLDSTNYSIVSGLDYILKTTTTAAKTNFSIENIRFIGKFTAGTNPTFAVTPAIGGIAINNASEVRIKDCYFQACWNAATMGWNADTDSADAGALNTRNVFFEGNYCYECLGGLQAYDSENVHWINNTFEKVADDAIAFLTAGSGSAPQTRSANIVGNIFKNGIYTNSNGVEGVGVFVKVDGTNSPNNVVDVNITGNNVENAYIPIYISNGSRITIDSNVLDTSKRSGIYLLGNADSEINISDNTIRNANTAANASHAFILSAADNVVIENNILIGNNVAGERGINVESDAQHVTIRDNSIKNVGGRIIYANGDFITVQNNRIQGSSNSTDGIYMDSCPQSIVKGNRITGSLTGNPIYMDQTPNSECDGNSIYATIKGIFITGGATNSLDNTFVTNNKIIGLTGTSTDGEPAIKYTVSTNTVDNVTISGNEVSDCNTSFYRGIDIGDVGGTINKLTFGSNKVVNNKFGVRLIGDFDRNNFTLNTIAGNASADLQEGSAAFTNRVVGTTANITA